MSDDELLNLHHFSRKNNLKLEITGMLLYKEGNFMQMLEGEEAQVLELYDKILKDKRHKDIYKIMSGSIKDRNYENWSMGFCNMNKIENYSNYEEFIEKNLQLRTFQDDAQAAYEFIVNFNETNR
jgi:hypothetical protein